MSMGTYPPHTPVDPERNVIWAIRKVMEDLPSIGKDSQAPAKMGGYNFRGIEQILGQTQALCSKHGVIFVPKVLRHWQENLIINGNDWLDQYLEVEYTIYGPLGPNDKITAGPVIGVGRDQTDKGSSKAMTTAFKQILNQVFQIGDKSSDTDNYANVPAGPPKEMQDAMEGLIGIIHLVPKDEQGPLREELRVRFGAAEKMSLEDIKEASKIAAAWHSVEDSVEDEGTF